MRTGLCALLFVIPFLALSQTNHSRLNELFHYVEFADSLSMKSSKTFYLEKFLKDNYKYKETWNYVVNNGKIIYLEIGYIISSSEFEEIYYINRGNLICSEEYEKVNYSINEDELKSGGIYYFESSIPKHVVTLGDKYTKAINNDVAVLTRFGKKIY